jgi:competence protein ComEA
MSKAIFAVCLSATIAAIGQTPLPEGEGKKLVERICTQCHGPENFTKKKLSKQEWEKVVDDMVEKGAEGTDAELDTVVKYLVKNFGKPAN